MAAGQVRQRGLGYTPAMSVTHSATATSVCGLYMPFSFERYLQGDVAGEFGHLETQLLEVLGLCDDARQRRIKIQNKLELVMSTWTSNGDKNTSQTVL